MVGLLLWWGYCYGEVVVIFRSYGGERVPPPSSAPQEPSSSPQRPSLRRGPRGVLPTFWKTPRGAPTVPAAGRAAGGPHHRPSHKRGPCRCLRAGRGPKVSLPLPSCRNGGGLPMEPLLLIRYRSQRAALTAGQGAPQRGPQA